MNSLTLSSLDIELLLSALAEKAETTMGRRHASVADLSNTHQACLERYRAVEELWTLWEEQERMPLGSILDIGDPLGRSERGLRLNLGELTSVRDSLLAMQRLRRWIEERSLRCPALMLRAELLVVDPFLCSTLERSFDEDGALSGREYPKLESLRQRQGDLRRKIKQELQRLVSDSSTAGMLQEDFYTERNGRYVLPLKSTYKRGFGVVHGRSQSGETVFVEPLTVLPMANALKEAEAEHEHELVRICSQLSKQIASQADALRQSQRLSALLDSLQARARLGLDLDGIIPSVGTGGKIAVKAARHPIIALSDPGVVPNDLMLDTGQPVLILTGPNAGGKTVALKTIGLFAAMVRMGIPLPAAEARFDFFPSVYAQIGDAQAVSEGLSTFSGHLLRLKSIVGSSTGSALVLLDELGVGTDPSQGSALAQAIVEALVDRGCLVALTTHFTRLKALAAVDGRYRIAAAEFNGGRPTFRLDWGQVGESHALSLATQLGLPSSLVDRARSLMHEEDRQISDLVEELERLRGRLKSQSAEQEQRESALRMKEHRLAEREAELKEKKGRLIDQTVEAFHLRLREREQEVKGWIALLQSKPSLQVAGRTLEQIREVQAEHRTEKPPPPKSEQGESAVTGQLISHSSWGKGRILKCIGARKLLVDFNGFAVEIQREGVAEIHPEKKEAVPLRPVPHVPRASGVRTPANTCDLRGKRVEEAIDTTTLFLDRMLLQDEPIAFILHGHGTGALKTALRSWLPKCRYARSWRPAEASEGGDAFTFVQL
jgi:DNA mismatch repair protein MutS2